MLKSVEVLADSIIKESNNDDPCDILPRWMAFYLAEQMELAKSASGQEKADIDERCKNLVLEIWKYKICLRGEKNPLSRYENLFRVLESIDPDASRLMILRNFDEKEAYDFSELPQSTQNWMDFIVAVDKTARIWIDYAKQQVCKGITDEKSLELDALHEVIDDSDSEIKVVELVIKTIGKSNGNKEEDALRNRISQLDSFIQCTDLLKKAYLDELQAVHLHNQIL